MEKTKEKRNPVDFRAIAAKGCFVYAYLRSSSSERGKAGSPYYVGLATRAKRPLEKNHAVPVPAKKSLVVVLKSGLTVEEARAYETFFIARYGRLDLGNGCLRNKTPGGESFANSPEVVKKRTKTISANFTRKEKQQAFSQGITVSQLRENKKKAYQRNSEKNRADEKRALKMTWQGYSLWVKKGRPSGDLSFYQQKKKPNHQKNDEHRKTLSAAAAKFYKKQALQQGFESLDARKKHLAKMKRERLMNAARALGMTKREYQHHQKMLRAATNA